MFPACFRCNREKNASEDLIVNPCDDELKEYLALSKQNPFRLKGIDRKGIGKKTIRAVGLNDAVRVMAPRMEQWEDIHQFCYGAGRRGNEEYFASICLKN